MANLKQILQLPKRASNKRIIQKFADEHGLVYFGSVSQHVEDAEIIRGMTVSHSHRDSHYCIGSASGYDVAFVERTDTVGHASTRRGHTWHILQIDLKTVRSAPHTFIGLHHHSDSYYKHLFAKYTQLSPISLGALAQYPAPFSAGHRVYAQPALHLEVERMITPEIANVMVKNFGTLAVEIVGSSLYVYSERYRLTRPLLEAMIQNATWLAGRIDNVS